MSTLDEGPDDLVLLWNTLYWKASEEFDFQITNLKNIAAYSIRQFEKIYQCQLHYEELLAQDENGIQFLNGIRWHLNAKKREWASMFRQAINMLKSNDISLQEIVASIGDQDLVQIGYGTDSAPNEAPQQSDIDASSE